MQRIAPVTRAGLWITLCKVWITINGITGKVISVCRLFDKYDSFLVNITC